MFRQDKWESDSGPLSDEERARKLQELQDTSDAIQIESATYTREDNHSIAKLTELLLHQFEHYSEEKSGMSIYCDREYWSQCELWPPAMVAQFVLEFLCVKEPHLSEDDTTRRCKTVAYLFQEKQELDPLGMEYIHRQQFVTSWPTDENGVIAGEPERSERWVSEDCYRRVDVISRLKAIRGFEKIEEFIASEWIDLDKEAFEELYGGIETNQTGGAAPASWSDVKIKIVDQHTIDITVGSTRKRHTFESMNLRDGRTNSPNIAWSALIELAEGRGFIAKSQHAKDCDAFRQHIKKLNKALCACVKISAKPVSFIDSTSTPTHQSDKPGWRSDFQISD